MKISPIHIHFYTKRKTESKIHTLYMRVNLDSERFDISLKYELEKDAWDSKLQKLRGRHSDQPRLTGLMNQYRHRAFTIYQELIQQGLTPGINEIRDRLTGCTSKNAIPGYLQLFDEMISRKKVLSGENNSPATIQKYGRCREHLADYIKKYYKESDLRFDQVNLKFVEEFEIYLKSIGGCGHNSTMKYMQTLRSVFKAALAHGYTRTDPFSKYKIRLQEVQRDFLTQQEVDKILHVNLPSEKLIKVRDLFIFSCYTGLAFIDIQNLEGRNIEIVNDQYWIRTFRQKTRVRTNVPLLKVALNLIEKYNNGIDNLIDDQPVFKVMSNQKMNDYLKIIAMHCGINKVLTYHIARHTFATTITLSNGVPIESVSAMLGHKRIATTQHYAKMVDKKLEEDMRKLADRLEK